MRSFGITQSILFRAATLLIAGFSAAANLTANDAANQSLTASDNANLVDGFGRLRRISVGDGWLDIRTDIRIPSLGWKDYVSLTSVEKPSTPLTKGDQTYASALRSNSGSGLAFDIEQKIHVERDRVVFDIKATSRTDTSIEGIYFFIDAAEDQFAGGSFMAGRRVGELPVARTQGATFSQGATNKLMFVDSASKMWANIALSPPANVLVKDQRNYGENFSAFVALHDGDLPKGGAATMQIVIETAGVTDDVVKAAVHTGQTHGKFMGFGGNYAFGLDSPIVRYTLDNLDVAMARTAMALADWEPVNDNDDPYSIYWEPLIRNDKEGSELRREFEMMAELSRRRIPYTASIWSLPAWMYRTPPKNADSEGNVFDEKMWPEVLECIGTYLLYAKEKYHAQADYLSFNEPNIGINVLFTADEHRAALRRIGEYLERRGLKTKVLLGDVSNPRGTAEYAVKAGDNPELLRLIGAVAFHSWGGGSPQDYADWSDAAARIKRPLLVTEAGYDPASWRDGSFKDFDNGIHELLMYQRILLSAHPQAVLFWEYTKDYSLLIPAEPGDKKAGSPERFQLSPRFCYQKQFAALTPPCSEYLETESDRPGVLVTAFRLPANHDGYRGLTVHISNPRWPHKLTLEGLPTDLCCLSAVHTTRDELYKGIGQIEVHHGKLEINLPAQSMTTLTTLPIPGLNPP